MSLPPHLRTIRLSPEDLTAKSVVFGYYYYYYYTLKETVDDCFGDVTENDSDVGTLGQWEVLTGGHSCGNVTIWNVVACDLETVDVAVDLPRPPKIYWD